MREGSLEAPTRHPLNWEDEEFYKEEPLYEEMERVFDICHGCRRCVNLCTTFPTLFDLIDESSTMEVDGVAKEDYSKVVDKCYLCDMCYMSKCPYVPPHEWNVDFPHLMLRAKAQKFKNGQTKFRDKLLSNTDVLGKLSSIPVVVQTINAVNTNKVTRSIMDKTLGIHKDRKLPKYAGKTFRSHLPKAGTVSSQEGQRTPGRVAVFVTCYVNYNEPNIGDDLFKVLDHNQILAVAVQKEACCGMPKLELGDLEAVKKLKEKNIPQMVKYARQGYALMTAVPSCTLMFKQELPLLFADDEDVQLVAKAMFDPFEYFVMRDRDGLLNTDFKESLGQVSYHVPCHLRVQNIGLKTKEMLERVPGTTVNTVERCSGHDGTWGVKKEYFADSMKIGRPVFHQMIEKTPHYISSDCAIAATHIVQGIEEKHDVSDVKKRHPITLLRIAYGL
ncbi:MAG: heterodisulfide reductase-related iron-sulfur binding cluster [Proteobacteria bacterium]|nr:heterodisulfide reductase-related iron-sulfur binding cluster [Pseudomonadota bacterium]MDA1331615.1 heterodisulfide reductase-related iron-sulfur binding cluster [Pseudomonadota bacterium]